MISIATAITSLAGTFITGFFGLQIVRANKAIKKTTEITLKHVNHQVIAQAKQYAVSARLNATLSKDAGYERIAKEAEAALAALIKAQAAIDRAEIT